MLSVDGLQLSAMLLAVRVPTASPPGTLGAVVSPLAALTVMVMVAVLVVALLLSVATARRVWLPALALAQLAAYGALVATPSVLPSRKNSTLATLPSGSLAVAVTFTVLPALKVAPLAGEVRLTTGGWLAPPPSQAPRLV